MKKILISEKISDEGLALLKGKAEIVIAGGTTEEAVLQDINDVFGIVLKSKTKITRKIIEAAPGLKIISRTGAGYDNVDVQAASEHNVMVCNLPGINAVSVAEHTMAFILALARKLPEMDACVRGGMWSRRNNNGSVEISGKTLGIIGLGQIGYKVMKMAQAFGMATLAYDPFVRGKYTGDTAFACSLEELFEVSDFITVHVPSLAENKHMISESLLGRMKPDAYLVNTSRGDVIDEKALIKVLEQGKIGGAALDVFENEPPEASHPFFNMKNVIMSPHTAALTKECAAKMTIEAVAQVVDCLEGRIPPHIVNREHIRISL
jgi:D-3-phosphoglycerate dehydrogenase